ncbi:MAG TPA: flagellar motor protein MotA [Hyphomicrobiaceae bacterium]|nr:flagellar motor protein MotA [Hyphomicrobiaceae bacterium]
MARARSGERAPASLHRTLSTPGLYLWRMFVFLVLVGMLVAVLHTQLWQAMLNNPGLNLLICVVMVAGILYAFQQVVRLYPEIRWVNAFRIADPGLAISHRPVLLAPMATMLRDRTGALSLSATSMRSIMDSIGSRLDEARDTGRYLVGLLVFLGLLGTFWGLLDTIRSVGQTIGALDTRAADSVTVFDELKNGLAAPLRGMGTAFSSSLLGLGGSLVLGFLELQAGHAHGRFYNQLEEWLSGITDLAAGGSQGGDYGAHQLQVAVLDMHRAISELNDRLTGIPRLDGGAPPAEDAVKELAKGVDQLVRQMRAEQKVVREWVDEQAAQQSEVASVLKDLAANVSRKK